MANHKRGGVRSGPKKPLTVRRGNRQARLYLVHGRTYRLKLRRRFDSLVVDGYVWDEHRFRFLHKHEIHGYTLDAIAAVAVFGVTVRGTHDETVVGPFVPTGSCFLVRHNPRRHKDEHRQEPWVHPYADPAALCAPERPT